MAKVREFYRAARDHVGFHRLLCCLDDVRGDRHPDPRPAWSRFNPVRIADRHAGFDWRRLPAAAWRLDRPLRRPSTSCCCCCSAAPSRFGCPPTPPRSGSFFCSASHLAWSALRSRSAPRMSRASLPRSSAGLRWASSAPAPSALRSTCSSRPSSSTLWVGDGAEGLCHGAGRHRGTVLDFLRARPGKVRRLHALDEATACSAARSACVEVLPILLNRFWRLYSPVDLDAAIFQDRIRPVDHTGSASCGLLCAAGGAFRAFGGWLSDRFGAHAVTWWVLWAAWICLFLLSYPKTELIIHAIDGPISFSIAWPSWFFTVLLFVLGIALAFGMASTFKYIGEDFPNASAPFPGSLAWPAVLAVSCCRSCSARSLIILASIRAVSCCSTASSRFRWC